MNDVTCSIKLAAKKSGVSPHLIRVWERRYDAISPQRTGTNRRLFTSAEIERLRLLSAAVQAGHRVGDIARLPDDQLRTLASELVLEDHRPKPAQSPSASVLSAALDAVRSLDEAALEAVLDRALVAFGGHGLLANVIAPLAREIGDLWQAGSLTAAHEHFATALLRTFLQKRFRPFGGTENAPSLIAVTPASQFHELGAVIAAAAANDLGWQAAYLGASLPAAEIAGAAIQRKARAVALSIVYPPDDPLLPGELQALRRHLPPSIAILAGGRAADGYAAVLDEIGAVRIQDVRTLYETLDALRKTPAGRSAPPPTAREP